MPSERTQRQIERLLDEAEQALEAREWVRVRELAGDILALDPDSADGRSFHAAAERRLGATGTPASAVTVPPSPAPIPEPAHPTAFVGGRYRVERFLGEGGKKRVYLAHDTLLDRDVAFALIKTEGLDAEGRARITREAQAMGRLGAHPHIVTIYDVGEEQGRPYLVTELMAGGDLEGAIARAPGHQLPLEEAQRLTDEVLQGLEFAHGQGIIHRDLKPGNVWLTESGIAKIGDFGLAMAIDRSRLTRAGMMVGTVAYMPPEQAMGGHVTAQSDLYALGAMLYELVCGRPPFVGEETVAIITQHLNTPPVAPSWHRPDCPPGLEVLILRLLEKDASKRPVDAKETLTLLTSISESSESSQSVDTSPSSDSPLYRRTFVGRDHELRELQGAYDAALAGRGGLVMVVGEPGIGKTALCEQLATYAAIRGGKALVGHCYQEGSLSLPYLPFVEAIRSYVLARDAEPLQQELGAGATEVARIVSEVRDKVAVEPRPSGDPSTGSGQSPEDDRWRLYQGVTGFLRSAGDAQPLLLILEDLHWADRGTLDYLVHLSRNLQGARLLIVGTYRDVDVDRGHPLSGTLAELRRAGNFGRVLLRGLTPDEVGRMLNRLSGQELRWSLAATVHKRTEGNPLFIQEMLRHLVEEGLLDDPDAAELRIPEGLRDVIGKRLSALSPECNRLLSMAAVIGREFRLDVLQTLAEQPEDAVIAGLEEAVRVGVLEDQSRGGQVRFRFAHAYFQQTLYEELFTPRRLRLHQQVARTLERLYGNRLGEHAAELAQHFAQSSDPLDLGKAVHYGEVAAGRAVSVYAYGEAVRHLETALQAQEVLDPDDKLKRCDLLLALGDALMPAGEPQKVTDRVAPEAYGLAEALGDRDRAFRACQMALDGITRSGGGLAMGSPLGREWTERGSRWAEPGTPQRARADMRLAGELYTSGQFRRGHALRWEAFALARALGVPALVLNGARLLLQPGALMVSSAAETHRLAEEFAWADHHGIEPRIVGDLLWNSGHSYLAQGDVAKAVLLWTRLNELAERTRDPVLTLLSLVATVRRHLLEGRLEQSAAAIDVLIARAEELGSAALGRHYGALYGYRGLVYLGRAAQAEQALEEALQILGAEVTTTAGGQFGATLAVCQAAQGRNQHAADLVRATLQARVEMDELEWTPLPVLAALLEAAVQVEDRRAVETVLPLLAPGSGLLEPMTGTSVARHLGAAAALLGDPVQAEAYYRQALEVCEKVRFRPEIALTRLQLAELLLDHHPDREAEAQGHLDFAVAEFRAMKMTPSLERALRRKGLLGA